MGCLSTFDGLRSSLLQNYGTRSCIGYARLHVKSLRRDCKCLPQWRTSTKIEWSEIDPVRIDDEENMGYLMHEVLLRRYSIIVNNEETMPANVVERAVDLHALRVMGAAGYQKVVNYLWRGWLVQDGNDPANFVDYKQRDDVHYWHHVDPDRLRAPVYQNAIQIIFSLVYLGLYTAAVNTVNPNGDLDVIEGLLYVFTAGFLFDEAAKFWKVGRYYLGFWNVFNLTLYALLTTSLIIRFVALSHPVGNHTRHDLNELSYNFLGE